MNNYLLKLLHFTAILLTCILVSGLIRWNIDLSTWTNEERSSSLVLAVLVYAFLGDSVFQSKKES